MIEILKYVIVAAIVIGSIAVIIKGVPEIIKKIKELIKRHKEKKRTKQETGEDSKIEATTDNNGENGTPPQS